MFDARYLATFSDLELHTLQDGCEQSAEKERHRGDFALAYWWLCLSRQVGAIIYARELERSSSEFAGEQLSFLNVPCRVSPEDRIA